MPSPGIVGQAMSHSEFREWARATLGDPRQVYARRADAPPNSHLVFMPDGEALQFREDAKSGALICPVPSCPSPELTTRACTDKRDHFMHVRAPGGRKEHKRSYMRIATQRLLHDWAAGQERVVEMFEAEVDGAAITLVARLDDGSEVALCYVDQRLGADAWEESNKYVRSEGVSVAWIFALEKSYFALPDPAEPIDGDRTDLILDRPIYKRMREKGSWPLLINVEWEKLANIIKPGGRPARRLPLADTVLDRVQHFVAYELAECKLCPYGIDTPAIPEYTLELTSRNWLR